MLEIKSNIHGNGRYVIEVIEKKKDVQLISSTVESQIMKLSIMYELRIRNTTMHIVAIGKEGIEKYRFALFLVSLCVKHSRELLILTSMRTDREAS